MMRTIETLQGTGVIKIDSTPSGASVAIDGEIYGNTPITIINVDPGTYAYTITLEGYDPYQGTLTVEVGELCYAKVDLAIKQEIDKWCTPTTDITPTYTPPIVVPGQIVISERTVIYILGGLLFGALLFAIIKSLSTDRRREYAKEYVRE